MNLSKALVVAIIPLIFGGCAAAKLATIESNFEKSWKDYIQHVRWNELESTTTLFVSESMREEFQKKIAATEKVKVVDYRVKFVTCDPVKGVASLKVELDYYRPPGITVKTVTDNQKWALEGPEEKRIWRLKTPLPDFE
jgi:hypothetical protein